jgi:hypothetical protein
MKTVKNIMYVMNENIVMDNYENDYDENIMLNRLIM